MSKIAAPGFRKVAAAVGAVFAFGAVTAFGVAPVTEAQLPPAQTVLEQVPLQPQLLEGEQRFVQTERLRRGDTVSSLLARLGAADPEFQRFLSSDPIGRKVLQLPVGRTVSAEIADSGVVHSLEFRLGSLEDGASRPPVRIAVRRESDRIVSSQEAVQVERSVEMRAAQIQSSLFGATDAAGIPESVAIRVADILDSAIDFNRDLRRGDVLRVAYEMVRESDSLDAPTAGRILAVELVNAGKTHHAVWFDADGSGRGQYYDYRGNSLKRAFLRNPIEFSRVTSSFSNARVHPIMKDVRAHRGVDFGAPIGTKVRVVGDGTVKFVGNQRGYGNVVIVEHRNGMSTLYAHLHSFGEGLRPGQRVSQGDTVGTVGMTGWATGPHLHFEFLVNGVHVDPMKVALPEAAPLQAEHRERFAETASAFRTQLAQIDLLVRTARFE